MQKPVHIVVLFVLVFMVALTGCGPKNTGGGTEPVATDTPESLVPIPTPIPPTAIDRTIRLDPAIVNDNDSLTVSTYVYDCLTRLDINGEPQPGLAMQWTPSDDQLDYVVTLRRGVKFTNGADFNADIVLANFNRWFDPNNSLHGTASYTGWQNYFLGFLGEVDANNLPISFYDGIEKVDAYTVLIHLNRPEPNLFAILASPYFAILDTQMLTAKGDSYGTSADTVSGTGAYEILTWNDSGLVLTPSPIFWGNLPTENLQFSWK